MPDDATVWTNGFTFQGTVPIHGIEMPILGVNGAIVGDLMRNADVPLQMRCACGVHVNVCARLPGLP